MERLTIRIPEDLEAIIEERADENDVSESAAVRQLLRSGLEYDDLELENERLRQQLAATNARQEDVDEIVEYVEEERELRRRREERIRRREERQDAPVWRRAMWWVFGRES